MIDLRASLVAYKTAEADIIRLVRSVQATRLRTNFDVVDNWGKIPYRFEKEDKNVHLIRPGANIGYGRGHNLSMRQSLHDATYHLILNPDIYVEPTAIESLVEYMEEYLDVGHTMPRVVYPNGELQYLCKLLPTPLDLFVRRFIPIPAINRVFSRRFELRDFGHDREINVPYLSGCFMLLRVDALRKVGLFDERFFMYPEDIDLTRRIHNCYRTVFVPSVKIIHAHARESYKTVRQLMVHVRNIIKYFNKWGWFFDRQRRIYNRRVLREIRKKL